NPSATVSLIPCRTYFAVKVEEKENVTTIAGNVVEEKITNYAKRLNENDLCPLRSRGIHITPDDVLILNQFITSDGEILSRAETGLSKQEFYKVIACVKMAQRANMLPGSEPQIDMQGTEVPKLNRYLTRYQIGSRTPIKSRGLWYRRRHYKVGDARSIRNAPRVGNRRLTGNL
uniref:Uncharacterized protein n=1 Tax=Ciona savignyi TaxID=51511 RepID=H2ZF51_CIOSA